MKTFNVTIRKIVHSSDDKDIITTKVFELSAMKMCDILESLRYYTIMNAYAHIEIDIRTISENNLNEKGEVMY